MLSLKNLLFTSAILLLYILAMNHILGLNGVYPRSHDTSACIVKVESGGAEILANAEEERFGDRDKRAFDKLPLNTTRFCLE